MSDRRAGALGTKLLTGLSAAAFAGAWASGCGAPATDGGAPIDLAGVADDAGVRVDLAGIDLAAAPPTVLLPRRALGPAELAVLVNLDDPQSVAVGEHYRAARHIPDGNMVELHLGAPSGPNLPAAKFATWKPMIDEATPPSAQAFAVTWTEPSVVDCMSLGSALAFGFDKKYCNTSGRACGTTAPSKYFDSGELAPFTTLGMRPAMILAGATTMDALALIDRGVAADDTFPTGDGYLLITSDKARSSRAPEFQSLLGDWVHPEELSLTAIDNSAGTATDFIADKMNVLFYFTGLQTVPKIETNRYRPGAVADHLTSFGGQIPTSSQMSILRWLEAGATGSYGTVVEPCNYPQKFPDPTVLVPAYYGGATLIEAYWQSVEWPGEGLFIGEPLARPWGSVWSFHEGALSITTTALEVGKRYAVQSAPAASGPWSLALDGISVGYPRKLVIIVPGAAAPFYRLVAK